MNAAAYLCAIRGPVLLITLGSLLAAHRFTQISFWKLWPVLIIVLGLMKLLEMAVVRVAAQPQPPAPPPPPPGGLEL